MDQNFLKDFLALFFVLSVLVILFFGIMATRNITGLVVGEGGNQTNTTNETVANATSNETGGPTGEVISAPVQNLTNETTSGASETNFSAKEPRKYMPKGPAVKIEGGWVLKKELSSIKKEDEFTPQWDEYEGIGNRQNVLVANLRSMIYDDTKLAAYDVQWDGGYLNLTFEYTQNFEGRCFQVGIEILNEERISAGTDFLTFNNTELVPEDSSDYSVAVKNREGNWTGVEAISKTEIPAGTQLIFFVKSLCTEGGQGEPKAYISNFVYSAV